jgi:uncharacterized membrane protein YeaQ/YmgE (transglycosylase-associated protein family)
MPVYVIGSFLLIGLCAGWIGNMLLKRRGFGTLGNLAIAMLGALVGGVAGSLAGLSEPGSAGSLTIAAITSAVLLILAGIIRKS